MWKWFAFNFVLAIVCFPGVLFVLPGSKVTSNILHALLFTVLHLILGKYVKTLEFFDNPDTNKNDKCPEGYINDYKGDCVLSTDKHMS